MAEETVVRIKLWGVIGLMLAALAYLTITDRTIENRVTRIEAQYEAVMANIAEVKQLTKDIRQDQIRRYRQETNRER